MRVAPASQRLARSPTGVSRAPARGQRPRVHQPGRAGLAWLRPVTRPPLHLARQPQERTATPERAPTTSHGNRLHRPREPPHPREAQTPGQGLAPHPQPSPQVPPTSTPNHHTLTRLARDPLPTTTRNNTHTTNTNPRTNTKGRPAAALPRAGDINRPALRGIPPMRRLASEIGGKAGPWLDTKPRCGLDSWLCSPAPQGSMAQPQNAQPLGTQTTRQLPQAVQRNSTRVSLTSPGGEQRRRGTSTASHDGQLPHREPFHTLRKRKPRSRAGAKPATSSLGYHPPSEIIMPAPVWPATPRTNLQPERGSHRCTNTNPAQNRGRVSPVRLSGLLKSRVVVVRGGLPDLRPPLLQGRRCGGRNSVFCWSEKLWGLEVGGLSDPFKVAASLPLQQAADRSPGMLRDACLAAALTSGVHPRP